MELALPVSSMREVWPSFQRAAHVSDPARRQRQPPPEGTGIIFPGHGSVIGPERDAMTVGALSPDGAIGMTYSPQPVILGNERTTESGSASAGPMEGHPRSPHFIGEVLDEALIAGSPVSGDENNGAHRCRWKASFCMSAPGIPFPPVTFVQPVWGHHRVSNSQEKLSCR
jgi:hypothetical protein